MDHVVSVRPQSDRIRLRERAGVGAGSRLRRTSPWKVTCAGIAVAGLLVGCADDEPDQGAGESAPVDLDASTTATDGTGTVANTNTTVADSDATTSETGETPAATGGVISSEDPRAAQIIALIEQAMPELALQTVAFGVWQGDEEIVRGAIDRSGTEMAPTSPDALVRVGQPMEAMVGTVLLQLHAEGVLDIDEPVAPYLPNLVNGDAITPRMLANTTSGTPDFVPNEAFSDAVYADPFRGWTTEELLEYAQQSPPLFEPGTGWAYSHTDIALLGEVLEQATGESLADLLTTRIFEPVGMTHAESFTTNEISTPTFRAFTNEREVYEESTGWNPTWALNSGNMNATVADLGRWTRALNRGELLGADEFELIMAPNTAGLGPMTEDRYFSFGMVVVGDWIVANPSLQGYQGFTGQLRDPEVTIVVYTTGTKENTGEGNGGVTLGSRISAVMAPDNPIRGMG